jgi:hypothetical protein
MSSAWTSLLVRFGGRKIMWKLDSGYLRKHVSLQEQNHGNHTDQTSVRKAHPYLVISEVLAAVNMSMLFWVVRPCGLPGRYQYLGKHHFSTEAGDRMFNRNASYLSVSPRGVTAQNIDWRLPYRATGPSCILFYICTEALTWNKAKKHVTRLQRCFSSTHDIDGRMGSEWMLGRLAGEE